MVAEDKEKQKIKKIAEFKTLLEGRIQELRKELEGLQVLLEFVDASLLEKGFKRAELEKPVIVPTEREAHPPVPSQTEFMESPTIGHEKTVPIKMVTGELLATLHIGEDYLRVVLSRDMEFNVNTPPFMAFLVERVLVKMQEADREAARSGKILPEKILSYNIVRDGDLIREITLRNISPDRSQELRSTIRWTLEKMYEKTAKTNS